MNERTIEQRTSEILAQNLAQAMYDQARTQALYEGELQRAQEAVQHDVEEGES